MRVIVESLNADNKPVVYEQEVESFTVLTAFDLLANFAADNENNNIKRIYIEDE